MAIIIIIFSFLILILNIFNSSSNIGFYTNLRESFIKSLIVTSFFSYGVCEALSFFNKLEFNYVLICWFIFLIIQIKILINNNFTISKISDENKIEINYKIYLITTSILILAPLLFLSIYNPPNNWDSMTYHLPRVEHWIQNKNIYPYPTNIIRQIISPPMSEYIIFQIRILAGNDYFVNLVQYLSYIGVLCTASLLMKILNLNYKGQIFCVIMMISLPMGIFQATTTQSDLIAAFFFLTSIYFGILLLKNKENKKTTLFFFLSSILIGTLVKYTILVFLVPYLFLFIIFLITNRKNELVYIIGYGILLFTVLYLPFLFRNIYYFNSILGENITTSSIRNEHVNIFTMLSNSIKNIADFISIPIDIYNNQLNKIIIYIHNYIGISLNDNGSNFNNMSFEIRNELNEDTSGSILHAIIILFSYLSYFFNRKIKETKNIKFILFLPVVSFLLYSTLFRWQPWGNRLILPITFSFILSSAYLIYISFENSKFLNHMMILLILFSCLPVYFNKNKPILENPYYIIRNVMKIPKKNFNPEFVEGLPHNIKNNILENYTLINSKYFLNNSISTMKKKKLYFLQDSLNLFYLEKGSIFEKNRIEKYFASNPNEYKKQMKLFSFSINNKINLKSTNDSYEYPLWVILREEYNNNFYIGSYIPNFKAYKLNVKKQDFFTTTIQKEGSTWIPF